MKAAFPSGALLAEVKSLLVGQQLVCGIGLIKAGKPTQGASDYEVIGLTRETLIVAPFFSSGGLNRRRSSSIRIDTGHEKPDGYGVCLFLHPVHVAALQQLTGILPVAEPAK